MPGSIASNASKMSEISVLFDGEEMTMEKCIDTVVTDLQQLLNDIQYQLRGLAAMDDLDDDPSEDFKQMLVYTDKVDDLIDGMGDLFSELKNVTRQILGPTPKPVREWYKEHVAARKAKVAASKAERKAKAAATKAFNEGLATINEAAESKSA